MKELEKLKREETELREQIKSKMEELKQLVNTKKPLKVIYMFGGYLSFHNLDYVRRTYGESAFIEEYKKGIEIMREKLERIEKAIEAVSLI